MGVVADPAWFIAEQIPQAHAPVATENSVVVAWQLGNLYLLMAFMGLFILNTTSEAKVVRSYLAALWLGDIGHVGFSCYGLGMARLMSPLEWNAMAWGNVVVTVSAPSSCCGASAQLTCGLTQVLLFLIRSAYFLGLFGPDRPIVITQKKTI